MSKVTLAQTKENAAIIECLKKANQCGWVGNITHDTLDKCLTAINYSSHRNSGWYSPIAVKLKGVVGIHMINQDGSILYDYRVIKESSDKFKIEEMSMSLYNEFESEYSKLIN